MLLRVLLVFLVNFGFLQLFVSASVIPVNSYEKSSSLNYGAPLRATSAPQYFLPLAMEVLYLDADLDENEVINKDKSIIAAASDPTPYKTKSYPFKPPKIGSESKIKDQKPKKDKKPKIPNCIDLKWPYVTAQKRPPCKSYKKQQQELEKQFENISDAPHLLPQPKSPAIGIPPPFFRDLEPQPRFGPFSDIPPQGQGQFAASQDQFPEQVQQEQDQFEDGFENSFSSSDPSFPLIRSSFPPQSGKLSIDEEAIRFVERNDAESFGRGAVNDLNDDDYNDNNNRSRSGEDDEEDYDDFDREQTDDNNFIYSEEEDGPSFDY